MSGLATEALLRFTDSVFQTSWTMPPMQETPTNCSAHRVFGHTIVGLPKSRAVHTADEVTEVLRLLCSPDPLEQLVLAL